MRELPPAFYARDTETVARDLIGCVLESRIRGVLTAGRIVEVEAYLGIDDPASHCFGGRRTDRTEPMYGPPGTAYVYFTYGMHWCLNAVTRPAGFPSAVLIRALEPTEGAATMARRRRVSGMRSLCSGPAKLCQALGVNGSLNGHALTAGRLTIGGPTRPPLEVVSGPRVGITRAVTWPLRFGEKDSPWLSRPFRASARS